MTSRKYDTNGWPEIRDNPLSKVGVFPYSGAMIDASGRMGLNPSAIYNVYRPESELSSRDTIDSFKLLPWIDDHEMLAKNLTTSNKERMKGVVGEEVYFKDKTLYGNIKLFSEKYLDQVIDGQGKRELSCGYRCEYEPKKGIFGDQAYDFIQRDIRGNHLASVNDGRMGAEVAVLDSTSARITFTIDCREMKFMPPEASKTVDKAAEIDPAAVEAPEDTKDSGNVAPSSFATKDEEQTSSEMTLSELTATIKSIAPQIAAIKKSIDMLKGGGESESEYSEDPGVHDEKEDTEAVMNKEEKAMGESKEKIDVSDTSHSMDEITKSINTLKAKVEDNEKSGLRAMLKEVNSRDALYQKVSHITGSFDHSEMTTSDVAKYACDMLVTDVPEGSELAAINGYLSAHNVSRYNGSPVFTMDSKKGEKMNKIDEFFSGGG